MTNAPQSDPVLAGVSVLELSGPSTMYAGQLLADFGADVVVLEPPSGARGRRIPPFLDDRPGPDRGFLWMSTNRGKRSCTLDPDSPDGRDLLTDLVAAADVVIHERPGFGADALDRIVDESTLRCVIHAFDPAGPKAGYRTTELVLSGASGSAALAGRPIGRPLFFPTPQSTFEIGSDAAVAVMAALVEPGSMRARRVDVLGRGAMLAAAFSEPLAAGAAPRGDAPPAEASSRRPGLPNTYRCSDGYAQISLVFGTSFDPKMTALSTWLVDIDVASPELPTTDWRTLAGRDLDDPTIARIVDHVATAVASRTRAEVTAAGAAYGFFAAPVYDMADVVSSDRLRRRGAFVDIEHPVEGGAVKVPLSFARITDIVPVATGRPPAVGEHTCDILREVGDVGPDELAALYAEGVI